MLGTIIEINDNNVIIKLNIDILKLPNLIGLHVIFEEKDRNILGEIISTTKENMNIKLIGEIKNNQLIIGSSTKPAFNALPRLIKTEELKILFGDQVVEKGKTNIGSSTTYEGYQINVDINQFFNSHFAVLGNSGSGKSCGITSILQKLFTRTPQQPINSKFFIIDAYGEYSNAFGFLHQKNPNLNYKIYTTNIKDSTKELLRIPIWLLDVDDLALLLDATNPSQLPIIEKALKLVKILTGNNESVIKKKNDIIARAIQNILLSGNDPTKIHDQVTSVLTKFNTPSLNLNSLIVQPGYTRTLKQCLYVDRTGKIQEIELVVEFIRSYIEDNIEIREEELNQYYTLTDLELAMDFALISEGILQSGEVFDYANILSVRLHTLASGENKEFFSYPRYITRNQFINDLITDKQTGGQCQIIDFNINYIDDRLAKVIVKIISKMLFKIAGENQLNKTEAYHIIVEEAHRYVQNDKDVDLIGYNIFERIAKEGRKYGVFLILITQRPSELSDTCISQCSNFLIFKTFHPKDLTYIKEMVPNVSTDIISQLKNLKPGNCIAFGSGFRIPIMLLIEAPNPKPISDNVDLKTIWYNNSKTQQNEYNYNSNIQEMPKFIYNQPINNDYANNQPSTNSFIVNEPNGLAHLN